MCIHFEMSSLCVLPILLFLILVITFIGTYITSVELGHVLPILPFISDNATHPPESCVFAQFINMASSLLGIIIYLRYRLILEVYKDHINLRECSSNKLNLISLWIGLAATIGLSMVANFQETRLFVVHMTGAFLSFGFGTIYCYIQAVLSYAMIPYAGSLLIAQLRLTASVLCLVYFFLEVVCSHAAKKAFKGKNHQKWLPTDGGYHLHIISTLSEWLLVTLFATYILSFAVEFRHLHLAAESIQVTRSNI